MSWMSAGGMGTDYVSESHDCIQANSLCADATSLSDSAYIYRKFIVLDEH